MHPDAICRGPADPKIGTPARAGGKRCVAKRRNFPQGRSSIRNAALPFNGYSGGGRFNFGSACFCNLGHQPGNQPALGRPHLNQLPNPFPKSWQAHPGRSPSRLTASAAGTETVRANRRWSRPSAGPGCRSWTGTGYSGGFTGSYLRVTVDGKSHSMAEITAGTAYSFSGITRSRY